MKPTSAFFAFVLIVSMSGSDSTSFPTGKTMAFAAASHDADSSEIMKASESDNMPIENGADGSIPLLPAVDPNSTEKLPTLKLGETLSLDELGPIILNTDGTTRRIDNWNEMTKREQEVTWRRIKKRNEERRNRLLQQQKEDEL